MKTHWLLLLLGLVWSCKKQETPNPFGIERYDPVQGVAGTTVTIQGMGFSTDVTKNSVKFGGSSSATVTSASPTQLVVTVPGTARTGRVTVEADGQMATSATDFTVPTGPGLTSFSPEQGEEGDAVTLKGYNFTSTLTVKFNGVTVPRTNLVQIGTSELRVVVPDGATTGKITLEDASGQTASSKEFTVIVPLSGKATVSKLAALSAYASAGADGVRLALGNGSAGIGNNLFITGPGQKTVYRMDLVTLAVAPFQTIANSPVSIAVVGDQLVFGDTDDGYYYTYRFDRLSRSTTANAQARSFSLKPSGPLYREFNLIGANSENELIGINSSTAGGNTASSFTATVVNAQLKGSPQRANAHLTTNGKSVFVFCNQTLWKLQADKTLKRVAGSPGQAGYVDGPADAARFQDGGYARGNAITVDQNDNVYVADYGSGCIRRVDASGTVTTVVGNQKLANSTGSTKPGRSHRMAFRFDQFDLALDPNTGVLYVIANNNESSNTLRFALYKVIFDA
ncbi:IPT/TIG domain-containing protein [uncultured Spirosoma sp.]|uniref:IPT/TIG domain-containing protein n=1 Tax=uncultured Spirosoma sp. TaxID=278208 RepID=UPI002584FD8F|nr:IPT/TIG domain-containing protein [uncultured Spirosoma sp.]